VSERVALIVIMGVAGTGALLSPAALASSSHTPGTLKLVVPTPSPGDVTIEGFRTTIASHGGKTPKLKFAAPNEDALPPSVLVLTATGVQRGRRSTTYHTVLLAINRRPANIARARAASDNTLGEWRGSARPVSAPLDWETMAFFFTGFVPKGNDRWSDAAADQPDWSLKVGVQPNANEGSLDPRACEALKAAAPPDGLFDTRLYDDGHATTDPITEIERAIEDSARDCRPGIGGLDSVLEDLDRDLGFGSDELGPPISTPPVTTPGSTTPSSTIPGSTTPSSM